MFSLEMCIDDAIHRIRHAYQLSEGKIYLSFSGGKDSTIVAHLIKMANLDTNIPFVFCNTGIEFKSIIDFVKNFDYSNKVMITPTKSISKVFKEHGLPFRSKLKSEVLATYQRNISDPLSTYRGRQLITGEAERNGKKLGFKTQQALAIKDFHILHPSLEYKISNKCCDHLKKNPSKKYSKENKMNGYYTGVRKSEGGVRSLQYSACIKVSNGEVLSMPIFDWEDNILNEFIEQQGIELCDLYTKHDFDRTGCSLCPYSKDVPQNLKYLFTHEPNKYRFAMNKLSYVYADQGVKLPFDKNYMKFFVERERENSLRKSEMIEKFKQEMNPKIRNNVFKDD